MSDPDKIYEQRCNEFRSLNGFLWQIPLIMMTLNGGLWFSVASLDLSHHGQSLLLSYAAVANIVMILALFRLRFVMGRLLAGIRQYEGVTPPKHGWIIVSLFSALMLTAAVGALVVARDPGKVFTKKPASESKSETPSVLNVTNQPAPTPVPHGDKGS